MSHKITFDRKIGPTVSNDGADVTTTSLTVTGETAPTAVTSTSYTNFVAQVCAPGSTAPTTAATCTDTQAGTYTLIKEVQFAGYSLDVFSRQTVGVNVATSSR